MQKDHDSQWRRKTKRKESIKFQYIYTFTSVFSLNIVEGAYPIGHMQEKGEER